MKKDQYIPHEVCSRSNSQVINLIETEGMAGYGIYWALLEYLRVQDNYIGEIKALASLRRQLKIRKAKLDKVLTEFGLFVCNADTFYSPKLNELMKPFEEKRARIDAFKRKKEKSNSLEISDNSSPTCDIISFEGKGKGKGEGKEEGKEETSSPISSSSAEAVAEAAPVSSIPTWERYVDDLQQDEQWKELMAMRTGLRQQFFTCFPRIVDSFKRHVRMLGNEGKIFSPSEAKRYFCFYLDPGSVTFKRLWEELHKPVDKGAYQHEDYDTATGKRSYCGMSIPADAPPRPNVQAVWCEGKWVY